jgi:hypothetical protein
MITAWLLLVMTIVVLFVACASVPSTKSVAEDVVNGLAATGLSGG